MREVHSNHEVCEFTRTVIGIAKRLSLEVIAEGVESASQASFLGRQGCNERQGYVIDHPLPAGETTDLIRQRSGRAGPVGDADGPQLSPDRAPDRAGD